MLMEIYSERILVFWTEMNTLDVSLIFQMEVIDLTFKAVNLFSFGQLKIATLAFTVLVLFPSTTISLKYCQKC